MKPFRMWDWAAALVVFIVSMAVYAYTAAPNVTLLDSGEFIVAAQHFGVPHPSGYPLWTLLSWMFSLLPLGNAAWEINLFSGVCTALGMGVLGLVISSSTDWMSSGVVIGAENDGGGEEESGGESEGRGWGLTLGPVLGVAFALAVAFTVPVWTQAVIAEVYGLHVLIVMLFAGCIYVWIRDTDDLVPFVAAMFFYSLGWSNHYLMISLCPLPVLMLFLLRKEHVWELIVYMALTASVVYSGFAILSNDPNTPQVDDPATVTTAIRFLLCSLVALAVLAWARGRLRYWKYGAALLFVVITGLTPYAYMPFASSTNPPMNWSYAREVFGMYYAVNRTQYGDTLAKNLVSTVGKVMGSAPPDARLPKVAQSDDTSTVDSLLAFSEIFWPRVSESFGWIPILCFFIGFLNMLRGDFNRRAWILMLYFSFLLAAFLQPVLSKAMVHLDGWLLQMPYHGYTFAFFGLVAATGAMTVSQLLARYLRVRVWMVALWLVVPLVPLVLNWKLCEQKDHWFGWHFGHDMLADLPEGSIFYGGSDPGRFVPTYMIFGESPQSSRVKRDPKFDRRDLYIITQNALSDSLYLRYLRDHYTVDRPSVKGWFERWLGRGSMYPEEPIRLPTVKEHGKLIEEVVQKSIKEGKELSPTGGNEHLSKWVFEQNKDKHEFYMEESFSIPWVYDYAEPHGLIFKINPEPLETLSEEVVERDREYWNNYSKFLLENPGFTHDIDARRSFSKLRTSIGNLYRHRKMHKEMEEAYLQALRLWPVQPVAINFLYEDYLEHERFDELTAILEDALEVDLHNKYLLEMLRMVYMKQEVDKRIQSLKPELEKHPNDPDLVDQLLSLHAMNEHEDRWIELAEKLLEIRSYEEAAYGHLIRQATRTKLKKACRQMAEAWVQKYPESAEAHFALASIHFVMEEKEKFYENIKKAVDYGGNQMRRRLMKVSTFQSLRSEERFKKILSSGTNSETSAPLRLNESQPQDIE